MTRSTESIGGLTVIRIAKSLVATVLILAHVPAASHVVRAEKGADADTPKAAAARKLLQTKITVNFKDTRLEDAIDEIKEEHVKGISIRLDTKSGVSRNQTINYKGENVTLEKALDEMFKKNGLGYIVISDKKNAYDGSILVRQGKERGYPLKK